MTYLVKIMSASDTSEGTLASGDPAILHYLRRVELPDVDTVRRALDIALDAKPRKPRSDRGTARKPEDSK